MPLVLVRVDERLVHGQVAVGWGRALSPRLFVVVYDRLAQDPWEEQLLQSCAPEGTRVEVWTIARALEGCKALVSGPERAFILLPDLATAAALVEGGAPLTTVNLGCLPPAEGKAQVLPYIWLGPQDLEILRRLRARGIALEARDVPTAPARDIFAVLREKGLAT